MPVNIATKILKFLSNNRIRMVDTFSHQVPKKYTNCILCSFHTAIIQMLAFNVIYPLLRSKETEGLM